MSSNKDDFKLFIDWVLIMCGIGLCMLPAIISIFNLIGE